MKLHTLAASAIVFLAATSFAHPPGADGSHDEHHQVDPAHLHTWTNAKTGEMVRGAFLAAREVDGLMRVSIEREHGDVIIFAFADLSKEDQVEAQRRIDAVKQLNDKLVEAAHDNANQSPAQAKPFDAFSPYVKTRWDDQWLYVESDGLPHTPGAKHASDYSHTMMVGITSWQQQVPLPQRYTGDNAWRIPLKPELADKPVSAKEQLFRGAIALAANGVPIFNPIKNDGRTDTYLAGELDAFGGHCGRADDYHYHIAPTHLQKFVGKGVPVAYALDGYPIYGYFDPTAKPGSDTSCPLGSTEKLDTLNGHFAPTDKHDSHDKGLYHYHASKTYPYLNGGMRGKVTVKDDQIDPQPSATPVRDWLQPLRGAKITGFKTTGQSDDQSWSLEYTVENQRGFVNYRIEQSEADQTPKYYFEFISPDGTKTSQTYEAHSRAPGRRGAGGPRNNDDNRDQKGNRPPKPDRKQRGEANQAEPAPNQQHFSLASDDITDGKLDIDCTCDGKGIQPALSWSDPPAKTKSFAVVIHHVPPEGGAHVYMLVSNIPASARSLNAGDHTGTWGSNTVTKRNEYTPPCSKGPGDKTYTITIYALSDTINPKDATTREDLLESIKDKTLATTSIDVTYARKNSDDQPNDNQPNQRGQRKGRRGDAQGDNSKQGGRSSLLEQMTAFKTDVPDHDLDVILVRPTDSSVTVTLAAKQASSAIVEYWLEGSTTRRKTPTQICSPGSIALIELTGLEANAAYSYRVGLTREGSRTPEWQQPSTFHTKRATNQPFTFCIQADSHLDQAVEPKVYEQTLKNILESKPDFMIDLGDTFMTDKRGQDFTSALPQYDAQRWYFSQAAHSAPLFMVLGNHDGEKGTSGTAVDDIGPWSFLQRTSRFPAPLIDGKMYTGNTTFKDGAGSHYYTFEWGDTLFIVLDPFWHTTERIRGGGKGDTQDRNTEPLKPLDASWSATLGRRQYDWLTETLANTHAKFKFVFIHHLVGGMGGPESRGGVESSHFFEWGGQNADGTDGFAEHRPGWPTPIHNLLKQHHVTAVFHGHDHLYVHSERDGLVYQCVPQPGNLNGNTRTATRYGYNTGEVLGSPGHVRVRVNSDEAKIEFVRTAIASAPDDRPAKNKPNESPANLSVVNTYTIRTQNQK